MENERLDAISRLLGSGGSSRRGVLAALAGAAGLGLGEAVAKHRHGGKNRGKAKGRVKSAAVASGGIVVVRPSALNGWVIVDDADHPAGGVEFVTGPETPPLGTGSVQLSTPTGKKAAIADPAYDGLAIADLESLGYATYMQNGSITGVVVPAIKLPVLYDNGTFTTLVFEPTYSENSDVVANEWQTWDALSADARWWSSKALPNDICAFDCFVSWDDILDAIPNAAITGGLLIETGSGTPDAVGNVDALEINGTTYDFEPSVGPPTDKNACKDGGWKTFDTPRKFTNQGDCIQFVNTGK
jgi:hypothetical protein